MRSLLEQSVLHHLNGEDEKANALFHQFIVARARQIHESMRNGEDMDDEEVVSEEYFGEDLADLESGDEELNDDEAEDIADVDADEEDADEAVEDFDADEEAEEDFGGDDDSDMDDNVAELKAELKDLLARFKELEGEEIGDDDDFDEDDVEDNFNDDFGDEEEDVAESDNMDDFEELGENFELEKVSVPDMKKDGQLVGAGTGAKQTINQNNRSNLPQRKVNDRVGGSPVQTKQSENNKFDRPGDPNNYVAKDVKDVASVVKGTRNTRKNYKDGTAPVAVTDRGDGKGVGTGDKPACPQNRKSVEGSVNFSASKEMPKNKK